MKQNGRSVERFNLCVNTERNETLTLYCHMLYVCTYVWDDITYVAFHSVYTHHSWCVHSANLSLSTLPNPFRSHQLVMHIHFSAAPPLSNQPLHTYVRHTRSDSPSHSQWCIITPCSALTACGVSSLPVVYTSSGPQDSKVLQDLGGSGLTREHSQSGEGGREEENER